MTRFRWSVLAIVFTTYTIAFADRVNIGVLLPVIKDEYAISNTEAGAMASFFFLGYIVTQIPAGYWFHRFGVRGLTAACIFLFSAFTYLIGLATTAELIKWCRLGLGGAQGPVSIGCNSAINNWFPVNEKGTALGVFMSSNMLAPIVVPPLCALILHYYSWHYIFFLFSIPGFIIALVWYWFIRDNPGRCAFCSQQEAEYITGAGASAIAGRRKGAVPRWLDRAIRAKSLKPIAENRQVFRSLNIWGITIAYFLMISVLYGLMTWIPSYLVNVKQYSFLKMGMVAAVPWLGGFTGVIIGGWMADRIFAGRRKPTLLCTTALTAAFALALPGTGDNLFMVIGILFCSGFFLYFGWTGFMSYPMGLTTTSTYPVAIALVNSFGNIGGFISPITAGFLLDYFNSYDTVFMYFSICALISTVIIMFLEEPLAAGAAGN